MQWGGFSDIMTKANLMMRRFGVMSSDIREKSKIITLKGLKYV